MRALDDWRGRGDARGMQLRATWLALADAAAALASSCARRTPTSRSSSSTGSRGFSTDDDGPGAAALLRPLDEDLFR